MDPDEPDGPRRFDLSGRMGREESPPDVAYTFWLGAATAGLRTAWPNVPLVSRAHGGDLYPHAHGWGSIPFQEAALRSVDLLAAVSSNGREDLARRHPEVEAALTVRHLGIHDLGGLAPTSRTQRCGCSACHRSIPTRGCP